MKWLSKAVSLVLCIAFVLCAVPAVAASTNNTIAGDINGDGNVNNKDLTRLFQYLSDWDVTVNEEALDVNGDNKVNNKDLTRLFQYLSDWDVEIFPQFNCDHQGGTATCNKKAICDICGKPYGDYDYSNHTGSSEIRNAVPPTCTAEGYSGDTYCLDCGKIISRGTIIAAIGSHGETEVRNEKSAKCTENGYTGDTYCKICGELLYEGTVIPATNHPDTVLRGDYPASCTADGYSGDTYCLDCGELLSQGSIIKATGHTGGKATYHSKAICSVCGEEYGSFADISAFDQLNENQKGIYNVFNRAIGALEMEWFDVPFVEGTEKNTMESDIRVALHAVAYDHPEYFWMPKTYSYQISTDKYTKLMTAVEAGFTFYSGNSERGFYNVTADEKQAMQAELDAKIEEILTQARRLDSDFEKERFIHDYLCENITYDDESSNLVNSGGTADFKTYTVYGALIEGTCVCEGYSRAMQLLLNRLGIKCGLVTGIGQGGPHMWNIINIDDGLYYTDVTFNDSVEGSGLDLPGLHTYFNITKDKLEKDHSLDDMYAEGVNYLDPNIDFNFFKTYNDDTEYYYFTKVGAYVYADNARDAAQYALDEYSKGHKTIEIEYDQSINSETAKYLLANALRGKLSISRYAEPQFGNYLIIVFK